MAILEDRTFTNETVHIDGTIFRRCILARCRLVYSGGDIAGFDGCTIDECDWFLEGAALRTLLFMRATVPDLRPLAEKWVEEITSGPARAIDSEVPRDDASSIDA